MTYVDGFLLVVPKTKLQAYKRMASEAGKVWKKYGALEYYECVGDDMTAKHATIKFPQTVKAKRDELVIFSVIIFKSRAHRDQVNAKVMKEFMKDPKNKEKDMPFDMKRMAYGGFKTIVQY